MRAVPPGWTEPASERAAAGRTAPPRGAGAYGPHRRTRGARDRHVNRDAPTDGTKGVYGMFFFQGRAE
ncbi:hypothetical protein GCM10009551_059570 [Nocardiopsis tropica]